VPIKFFLEQRPFRFGEEVSSIGDKPAIDVYQLAHSEIIGFILEEVANYNYANEDDGTIVSNSKLF